MRQLSRRERWQNYADIAMGLWGFSRRPFAPRAHVQAYQLERLQAQVAFAYADVPLYREKYRNAGILPEDIRSLDDLRHLPTVSKREVLDAFPEGCLARNTDLSRCLVSKSSGSTGEVLSVVHRGDRIGVQGLALHRLISMMGPYRPWHRFTYVYTSEYPARGALGAYPMEWIHTLAPISEIARRLERSPPTHLACYPSHLRQVAAELGERRARALGLRGVSVSSELSSAEERAKLAETFGCGVFDEYSTEELTRVAAQCDRGTYHLFEDVVLTEIVAADSDVPLPSGTRGEVVGTYLHAGVMPFIRYRQGDVAEISSAPCGCGRTTQSLGRLEGRKLDSFVLPSGRVLTSGYLLDATYAFLFDVGADLAAFRLVQTHVDRVRIDIVPGVGFVPEMSQRIERHFRFLAGEPLSVEVAVVSSIEPSPAGKRHPIVSLVACAKDPPPRVVGGHSK